MKAIAEITAFLYAGALSESSELFESFGGHIGFVDVCIDAAGSIANFLQSVDVSYEHPGVMAYEIIEPLGRRILLEKGDSNAALQWFKESYADFVAPL